jgi:hypothetical protein
LCSEIAKSWHAGEAFSFVKLDIHSLLIREFHSFSGTLLQISL